MIRKAKRSMPHVDEGKLHALLDGELGAAEVLEVQTHFATCPACAARLDEARHLLAETERLVTALEPPAEGAARAPRLMVGRPMLPLDPVVLIPDNPTATEVRRNRFKIMAWAAGFLVVVGAGFFGLEMRSSLPGGRKTGNLRIRPEEFTFGQSKQADSTPAAAAPQPAPVARSDEAPQRPSPFATATPQPSGAQPQRGAAAGQTDNAPPDKAAADRKELADKPPAPVEKPPTGKASAKPAPVPAQKSAPPPAQKPAPAAAQPSRDLAQAAAPAPRKAEPKAGAPQAAEPVSADNQDATEDRGTIAARAAKATEELDREAMRQRAAQATADLDRQREQDRAAAEAQRRDSIQAANAAAPHRAVPTIDQQARLSSRIGLDEAAHQLGGPLHAIDGMTRQLVGLVSPQLVPGSDTTRPVVRAVYVDRTGRTIYLDQQRVRPGQLDLPFTPQTGPNGQQMWMTGSVLLVLQGDLGPDSLRSLSRRVR
jgi:hypothetical protein